jgi:hypothetical protein
MDTMRTACAVLVVALGSPCAVAQQIVVGGTGIDYQASVAVPWKAPDRRVLAFERLDGSATGDIWLTRSEDGGDTWDTPVSIVASFANERHPALVQTGESAWSLFHLSNASGGFRIHRATSSDAANFSASAPVDLGWPTGGEINPHVIRRDDGTLVLAYQRLGGAAYIAISEDDGATWNTPPIQVTTGSAALPRIVCREDDDTCLLVYQTGSQDLTLWVKTSTDLHDWSAPARPLTSDGNNHDPLPLVLADGSFVVLWSRMASGGFQVFSTRSHDGVTWQPPMQHTERPGLHNVQPHAVPASLPGTVELYWGAAQLPNYGDVDIAREAMVLVADWLFRHDFETVE